MRRAEEPPEGYDAGEDAEKVGRFPLVHADGCEQAFFDVIDSAQTCQAQGPTERQVPR
jgi:hypothetical protein